MFWLAGADGVGASGTKVVYTGGCGSTSSMVAYTASGLLQIIKKKIVCNLIYRG